MFDDSDNCGVFESPYAIGLMIRAFRNPGLNKKQLVDGSPLYVKYKTLEKLIAAGLLRADDNLRVHNAKLIYPTELGECIAKELLKLNSMMGVINAKDGDLVSMSLVEEECGEDFCDAISKCGAEVGVVDGHMMQTFVDTKKLNARRTQTV